LRRKAFDLTDGEQGKVQRELNSLRLFVEFGGRQGHFSKHPAVLQPDSERRGLLVRFGRAVQDNLRL
jgi:hypothetical protein